MQDYKTSTLTLMLVSKLINSIFIWTSRTAFDQKLQIRTRIKITNRNGGVGRKLVSKSAHERSLFCTLLNLLDMVQRIIELGCEYKRFIGRKAAEAGYCRFRV